MHDHDGRVGLGFALISAGIAFFIVYGSLYPFHFLDKPDLDGPLHVLLLTWHGPFGRGDFAANVLFYVPLGFFLLLAVRRSAPVTRLLIVTFSGVTLSEGMELLQFYDEGRVSALADVYANTIGVAAGAGAGAILLQNPSQGRAETMARRPFVILLLTCWLGYRLFPFVPVIDLHKYWSAIKPLIYSPTLPFPDFYRHTVSWLAVALLVEALLGTARSRLVIPALVLVLPFARVLILDAALSPAEVAGGVLAALLWQTFLWRWQARAFGVVALFAGAVAIQALQPFHFTAAARPFGWIPFAGFMQGSIEVNIRSFLEKAFSYGALVWLLVRAGRGFTFALGLSSALVLCLRLGQIFLPGRSAEITDPVMVLMAGGVMKLMGEDPAPIVLNRATHRGWRAAVLLRLYEFLTRHDSVQPVDLIFVMAGRMERKAYGLELYRAGVASRLILSVGRYEVSRMSPADWDGIDELKSLRDRTPPTERHFFMTMDVSGVRIEKAKLLRCSTYGEALAFRSFLECQQARKVMVISTDVHLRRVEMTFASVFSGVPVQFLYCQVPTRFGTMVGDNWWSRPADRWFVIREMAKLAGYRTALSAPLWAAHRLLLLTGWGRK
jgi:VanZ family protein/uncharacterized SAM-binding protein YcdF (DUF218 family)